MAREHVSRKSPRLGLTSEHVLPSVNLCYDVDEPERVSHFQPTAKSAPLIKALLGEEKERAFFVVAPYGSGKSLTATYVLHLTENRPQSTLMLRKVEKRLDQLNPELGRFARARRKRKTQGIVIPLHGYAPSLARTIRSAVLESARRLKLDTRLSRSLRSLPCKNIDDAVRLLEVLKRMVEARNFDRILILWDEFGRHLESLVSESRPSALIEIQVLAEYVSRSKGVRMSLGLLLHQGLLQYARSMPQSARSEWAKVEGRFKTIQFVDDSKEIYRLVGAVVSSMRTASPLTSAQLKLMSEACKDQDLFSDFTAQELVELLRQAYPLEPATLYLLPRISARVAQNERTLFSFISAIDTNEPIGPEKLYDYFSVAMRADTATGGTYRQWLETQSAISKVSEDNAVRALKIACLLGLGTSGERTRSKRGLLSLALRGYNGARRSEGVIERLLQKKLLLHRLHNDQVSVWHGTDADLRGRLDEEKRRHRHGFELLPFLRKEAPLPVWTPATYNDDFCIRRYFIGEYGDLSLLEPDLGGDLPLERLDTDCDGKIVYIVANDSEELQKARKAAEERLTQERVILAVSREPIPLFEAALEVWCLTRMQLDSELIACDPLVLTEIQQMADDARGHLQRALDRLTQPGPVGPIWYNSWLKQFDAESARAFRQRLSEIMARVYRSTPKINNEMIVRKKPSPVMINSRKKLVFAILERSGTENLGLEGNTPDVSMFRTVFIRTKLYRKDKRGRWGYARPAELKDKGLEAIWREIHEFLTSPSQTPKEFAEFLDKLMAPPYGVRRGLLPILLAAGLKAFPSAISLTREGAYVSDILPSEIERLCREPKLYQLVVLDIGGPTRAYLRGLQELFCPSSNGGFLETDLIRMCSDALESWKAELPAAALHTRSLSSRTQAFRTAVHKETDPLRVFLEEIPAACGYRVTQPGKLVQAVRECMDELMSAVRDYQAQATICLTRWLAFGRHSNGKDVRALAARWADCFPASFVDDLPDGVARGFLTRMRTPYDSDELLLESLSSLLVGRSLSKWDDATATAFDSRLREVVHRVEEAALSARELELGSGSAANSLAQLVQGRMSELYDRLVQLLGSEQAKTVLTKLCFSEMGTTDHGHDPRRTA